MSLQRQTILYAVLSTAVALGACAGQKQKKAEQPKEPEDFCSKPFRGLEELNGGSGGGGGGLGVLFLSSSTTLVASTSSSIGYISSCLSEEDEAGGEGDVIPFIHVFVADNREVVLRDIARGRGETLRTLSNLGGCVDARAVGIALQQSYQRILSGPTSDRELSKRIIQTMRTVDDPPCTKL